MILADFFNDINLKSINTLTKYPSIPTYHEINGQNNLLPNLTDGINFNNKDLQITEKIDGENTRLIIFTYSTGAEYIIGSRTELLYCSLDGILQNKETDQVATLKPLADKFKSNFCQELAEGITVMYFESYGGKIQNSKQYTLSQQKSYRLFDVFFMEPTEYFNTVKMPIEQISRWREHGNQPYFSVAEKTVFIQMFNLPEVPVYENNIPIPKDRIETYHYLKDNYWGTRAGLDNSGRAEGIVVRTPDRKMIAKLRFEDYEKSFRREKIMDGNNNFLINK